MSSNNIRKLYELRNNFKYAFAYQFLAYPYEFLEINKKNRVLDYLKFFWAEFVKNENLNPETYAASFESILPSREDYYDLYYSSYDSNNELMLFIKMPDILDINEPDVKYSWHNSVGVGYILYYNKRENTARFYVCESSMKSSMDMARLNGQYVPVYFAVEIISGSRRNLSPFSSNSLDEVYKNFYSLVLYDLKNNNSKNNDSDEDDENNQNKRYEVRNKLDSRWDELSLLEKIKIALNYDKDDKQYKNVRKTYKEFVAQLIQNLIRGMSLKAYFNWASHSEEKYSEYNLDRDYTLFIDSIDFLKPQLQDKSFNEMVEGFNKEISIDKLIDNICDFARYWGIRLNPEEIIVSNNYSYRTYYRKPEIINEILNTETYNLIGWLSEDNTYSDKKKFDKGYREIFDVLFADYISININEHDKKEKLEQIRKFITSFSNKLNYGEQKRIVYDIRDFFELEKLENIIHQNIAGVIEGVFTILTDKSININDSSAFDGIRNKFVYLIENLNQQKDYKRIELDTELYKCKTINEIVETMKPVVSLIPNDLQPKLAMVLDQLLKR